jgi:hypothetical protein
MRSSLLVVLLFLCCSVANGEDSVSRVRKAVEHSTLDQRGTEPFHLKASVAPSFESDRDSNRNGTVEIWWLSPDTWRRELTAPGLHLVEISNNRQHWQHTEGEFLPEWLREISIAVVKPVPDVDKTLAAVKSAEIRSILGSSYFSWMEFSTDGSTRKAMGAGITLHDNSGLISSGSGFGWSFSGEDYKAFHKRMIAQKVIGGGPGPEVTAKLTVLEDLGQPSQGLFDIAQPENDAKPLRTVLIDELSLRKNLIPMKPAVWPVLKDGPLEGAFTADVVVDRDGKIREIGTFVSDNPGLEAGANEYISSMRFQPYLVNGEPVQVYSRLTFPFKTTRPAGAETFDSVRSYFERSRQMSSGAGGGNTTPYVLHASFEAATKSGVGHGEYTDSWYSTTAWCRDAVFEDSHLRRCRKDDQWYLDGEGSHLALLQVVLKAIEPIPAMDTFVESDWRIVRSNVDGQSLVRVATGHESDAGVLDAQSRGLWFDSEGLVRQAHFRGLDAVYLQFEDFHGSRISREIRLLANGKLGLRIQVNSIQEAANLNTSSFKLSGHEWKRQFTDEAR